MRDITVKDIVYSVKYNRSTFYNYFADKESITKEIVDEMIGDFLEV